MTVADKRKPKPPGFVGFREVLTVAEWFVSVDSRMLSRLVEAPQTQTMNVIHRCVKMGWLKCRRPPTRGHCARPGLYAITEAGLARLADPRWRTDLPAGGALARRGGRRDAGGTAGGTPALRGGVGRRDAGGTAGKMPALRGGVGRRDAGGTAGGTPALRDGTSALRG